MIFTHEKSERCTMLLDGLLVQLRAMAVETENQNKFCSENTFWTNKISNTQERQVAMCRVLRAVYTFLSENAEGCLYTGICSATSYVITNLTGDYYADNDNYKKMDRRTLWSAACNWKKFSGDKNFPIQEGYSHLSRTDQFYQLELETGRQKELRVELLTLMIKELDEEIEMTLKFTT